uniref:BESS domain-containing protein n=1 Tax=Romanomermis culicivorax TaxID=13658 RepID=A0A915ID17_ROMCU
MVDEALLKYLKEKSGDKNDEDLLFVKSIGASLAKLNPRIKHKAKLAILQVINDAEEEQEQQVASTNQTNIQHALHGSIRRQI